MLEVLSSPQGREGRKQGGGGRGRGTVRGAVLLSRGEGRAGLGTAFCIPGCASWNAQGSHPRGRFPSSLRNPRDPASQWETCSREGASSFPGRPGVCSSLAGRWLSRYPLRSDEAPMPLRDYTLPLKLRAPTTPKMNQQMD